MAVRAALLRSAQLVKPSKIQPSSGASFRRLCTSLEEVEQRKSLHRLDWDYKGQRNKVPFGTDKYPYVAVDAWVAPNSVLVGDVRVYDRATVWHGAVLRGDLNRINVGFSSNVMDRCVLHVASQLPTGLPAHLDIGRFVTIGANSCLRSCVIENEAIIGERCILMEGSIVETHAILEPGSVLPPGRIIPSGEVWGGNPARYVRKATGDETGKIVMLARALRYIGQDYMDEFLPYSTAYLELEKLRKEIVVV